MNKTILSGHLGADPEVTFLKDGRKVAKLRVPTSKKWKDKDTGEVKEKTQWHNVVCFRQGLVKVIEDYLTKGSLVLIEGEIEYRTWNKDDGSKGYATDIILANLEMLGGKPKSTDIPPKLEDAPEPEDIPVDEEMPF